MNNAQVLLARFAYVVFLTLFSFAVQAQPQPLFADIPWGSNVATVRAQLARAGYTAMPVDEDGDLSFEGYVLNQKMTGIVFFAKGKAVKVSVDIQTPDVRALAVFNDMLALLSRKYGPPLDILRTFEAPYRDGDGNEVKALRAGKGYIAAGWTGRLLLGLTDRVSVLVTYESEAWSEEVDRRKTRNTRAF